MLLALCPARGAAESTGEGAVAVFGGLGLTRASLRFRAPTARIDTRVDALPTVAVGVTARPERAIGLHFVLDVGTGAALDVPGTNRTLRYTAHRLDTGGTYRWALDPGGDGLDLRAGLGLTGVMQQVQAQTPALLVDSQVAGPAVAVGLDKYFRSRRFVAGLTVTGAVPFFVRESPRDSGDPGRFLAWGLVARAAYAPSSRSLVSLDFGRYEQHLTFRGEGTRATGVDSGAAVDRFDATRLAFHWQL
jgi:hypothetical protein